MLLGPAGVHAQQHAGPVVGLGSAGAGIDLNIGVVAISLARQQGLQLGPGGPFLDRLQLVASLIEAGFVTLLIGHFGQGQGVLQAAFQAAHRVDLTGQPLALAHQRLGLGRIVPQGRILDPGVQFIEVTEGWFPVKDAS